MKKYQQHRTSCRILLIIFKELCGNQSFSYGACLRLSFQISCHQSRLNNSIFLEKLKILSGNRRHVQRLPYSKSWISCFYLGGNSRLFNKECNRKAENLWKNTFIPIFVARTVKRFSCNFWTAINLFSFYITHFENFLEYCQPTLGGGGLRPRSSN